MAMGYIACSPKTTLPDKLRNTLLLKMVAPILGETMCPLETPATRMMSHQPFAELHKLIVNVRDTHGRPDLKNKRVVLLRLTRHILDCAEIVPAPVRKEYVLPRTESVIHNQKKDIHGGDGNLMSI